MKGAAKFRGLLRASAHGRIERLDEESLRAANEIDLLRFPTFNAPVQLIAFCSRPLPAHLHFTRQIAPAARFHLRQGLKTAIGFEMVRVAPRMLPVDDIHPSVIERSDRIQQWPPKVYCFYMLV